MLFERRLTAGLFAMGAVALVLNACGSSSSGSTAGTQPGSPGAGGAAGSGAGAAGGADPGTGGSSAAGSSAGGTTGAGGGGKPPTICDPTLCPSNPPVMGMGAAPDGMGANIQAINKLYLGDTDTAGVASSTAWQNFGFPISGYIFKDAKGGAATHCKPQDGAKPADVIVNGTNGVDNSFGKNIVPIVLGLASDAAQKIQDAIAAGNFSVLLKIDKLGAATDYNGLSALLFASRGTDDGMGGTVAPPMTDWSGYTWHPFDSQTTGVAFPMSYTVKNKWVSGSKGDVSLTLSFAGYDLALLIHQGQIAMDYAADHKTSKNGQIGGVLGTEQLTSAVKAIAGKVSPSLCKGSALDGVLAQIKQASDIGVDGKQDATKVCDGISIGLGFETTTSQIGTPAPPTMPKDACAGM